MVNERIGGQLVDSESIMSTEPTRTRVVACVRVSTDKQASDGLSLDIIATRVDACASAKSLDRPALQEALALFRSGKATALFVVKIDHVTRSVRGPCDLVDDYFWAARRGRQQPRRTRRRRRGRGARRPVGDRGSVR